jgi:hypothetical protein
MRPPKLWASVDKYIVQGNSSGAMGSVPPQGKTLTYIGKVESVIGPVVYAGELGAWSGPACAPCRQRW